MTTAATDTRKNAVDHDTETDTSNMLTMFSWGRKKRVRSVGGSGNARTTAGTLPHRYEPHSWIWSKRRAEP